LSISQLVLHINRGIRIINPTYVTNLAYVHISSQGLK